MTEHFLSPGFEWSHYCDCRCHCDGDGNSQLHDRGTVQRLCVWWEGPSTSVPTVQEHLVDVNNNPTYFGYALSQYARFIRPGYLRYNATATPVTGVYLSAYEGNGHQMIVVINSTSSQVTLPILIESQTVTSMTPYQTTSSLSVSQLNVVAVTNNEFAALLPAQSITTYVQ